MTLISQKYKNRLSIQRVKGAGAPDKDRKNGGTRQRQKGEGHQMVGGTPDKVRKKGGTRQMYKGEGHQTRLGRREGTRRRQKGEGHQMVGEAPDKVRKKGGYQTKAEGGGAPDGGRSTRQG